MGGPGSGRKHKPIEKLLEAGTFRPSVHAHLDPDKRPTFVALDAEVPGEFDAWARAAWARVYPLVTNSGLLSERERDVLTAYCIAVGRVMQSAEELRRDGIMLELKIQKFNRHGEPSGIEAVTRENPWLKINRDAMADMGRFAVLLGLTAVDRARVLRADVHDKPPAPVARPRTYLDRL